MTPPLPPTLCRNLDAVLAADVAAHSFDAVAAAKEHWQTALYRSSRPNFQAGQQRMVLPENFNLKSRSFSTPLLAANAVVFISGSGSGFCVIAVNRADRSLLWDVKLPAQPVLGGLSLTRAGDVLVPLVDGRVVCIGT
jgi:hypothetical protein